jgi:hypothetical protein
MSDLIRILYISRATFEASSGMAARPAGDTPALEQLAPEIRQILTQSRSNNLRAGLVGMLYFDDGHFFQCIEGERGQVEALYRKLAKDSRHQDLKLLMSHRIPRLSFPDWGMKYVPVDGHARQLLEQHGFDRFDPYRFDHHLLERMLHLMQGMADPTEVVTEGRPSQPACEPDCKVAASSASVARPARLRAALGMSGAALLISLATLAYVLLAG